MGEPNGAGLDILLVEDNPGDRRLIQEMLTGGEAYLDLLAGDERPGVREAARLDEGLAEIEKDRPDVVLLDLNLPDAAGLETLAAVEAATAWVPIVVLTGLRDRETGLEALQRGAQDFLVKDEVSGPLLARAISHAIERERQERRRVQRQAELEWLNRLNRITGDITRAVIRADSRSDLEQRVCDRLVADDAFTFAWLAVTQPATDELVPAASAGNGDEYVADIEVRVDDGPLSQGPGGRAIQEGTVQVVDDVREDESFEPWREEATVRGFRSLVAIPIRYEQRTFGVLGIYSRDTGTFGGIAPDIFERLGDVVGHAITALDRRDALVSPSVVQLEFRLERIGAELIALTSETGSIDVDHLIEEDEGLFAYGTVRDIPREAVAEAVANDPTIESVRFLTAGGEEYGVELVVPAATTLFTRAAEYGVRFGSATVEDGDLRFILEIPQGQDTRTVLDLVTGQTEDVEFVAQRTAESQPTVDLRSLPERTLTERQRVALEMAFYGGHFEWPRQTTGEELAERLDISPATFAQHLRAAERKIFDAILQGTPTED